MTIFAAIEKRHDKLYQADFINPRIHKPDYRLAGPNSGRKQI
ncbi:hypothetical protein SLH49_13015 [Cognatiyoonia sp. IB215446]|nr:hypothetical protein [Cognatiyoonia sp. IB215446]MDX8348900.1 hypothetical protein [Cognatiyoonia sp. IB215446]